MPAPAPGATPGAGPRGGGIALAAVGAIAASGKAVIVKLAYRHGVDATTLLALRMLMAFPLFALLAVWSARRATALSWGDRGRVLWLGFTGYYLSSLLDFQGLQYISVTLERLILYLNPTLVLLISLVLLKKRPGRWQLVALGLQAGHAKAHGDDAVGRAFVGQRQLVDGLLHMARHLGSSGQVGAGQQHHKLFAAKTCGQFALAPRAHLCQCGGQGAQAGIPRQVAVVVVEVLEHVHIQQDERQRRSSALGARTGPAPVAAYSALLMSVTEGRCYGTGEMRALLTEAGFGDIRHQDTACDRSIVTAVRQ